MGRAAAGRPAFGGRGASRRDWAAILRRLGPRRTIWPTRDGWWCLLVVLALGVAAINTGNNLLYLLVSLLLSLIIVSGILSEQVMRGVRLTPLPPEEAYAGRTAVVGARLVNTKRWLRSYSLTVEVLGATAAPRRLYVSRLLAGEERLLYWEETPARRGRQPLGAVRLTTRFPFGLFVKAGRAARPDDTVVYPPVRPLASDQLRSLESAGEVTARRRGRGTDLHSLRGYRAGDDPRRIHWRSTAKTGVLTVREHAAETSYDVRLVLVDAGDGPAARLEEGLAEGASLAAHLLRRDSGVELVGAGAPVPLGRGRAQRVRVLTALALYERSVRRSPGPAPDPPRAARRLREIRVRLG